ncbi:unnamed protein product [Diamesa hyperborea]
MPTTTALTKTVNPTVVSVIKDDNGSLVSPQSTLHDTNNAGVSCIDVNQLPSSSPTVNNTTMENENDDDSSDMMKASVNGSNSNLPNGNLLTTDQSTELVMHSPISLLSNDVDGGGADLNMKTSDMSCLNVVTTSPSSSLSSGTNNYLNGSNGHMLLAQSNSIGFPSGNSPEISPWSIGDDSGGSSGTLSGFVNYSSPNNQMQSHKRPIMSQQQQQPQQQQQQQHIHGNHGFASSSSHQGLSPNSPSKYRRSTSYPGKNISNMHGFQMDVVGGIIEDNSYMPYQDRGGAMNNGIDMRSLEHCLNDITNTGVQSDHLKGK